MKKIAISGLLLSTLLLPNISTAGELGRAMEAMVIRFSEPEKVEIINDYSAPLKEVFKRNDITEDDSININAIGAQESYIISAINFGVKTRHQVFELHNRYRVTNIEIIKELSDLGMTYQTLENWDSVGISYLQTIKTQVTANLDYHNVKPWTDFSGKHSGKIYLYDVKLFNSLDLTPKIFIEWLDFGVNSMTKVIQFREHGITIAELKSKNIKVNNYQAYKKFLSSNLSAAQLSEISNSLSRMKLMRFNSAIKKYPNSTPEQILDMVKNGAGRYSDWYDHGIYDPAEIRGYVEHRIFSSRNGVFNFTKVSKVTNNNIDLFWPFLEKNNLSAKEAVGFIRYNDEAPTFELILERRDAEKR